jgi:hypothetical protein
LTSAPTDVGANNILWLFPRIVLRRDMGKDLAKGGRRGHNRAAEREYINAVGPDDNLSNRIKRFTNGDWQGLYRDYQTAANAWSNSTAAANSTPEAAIPSSTPGTPSSEDDDRLSELCRFQAIDRLVGVGELSRANMRLVDDSTPVHDVNTTFDNLIKKHPSEGGLSDDDRR